MDPLGGLMAGLVLLGLPFWAMGLSTPPPPPAAPRKNTPPPPPPPMDGPNKSNAPDQTGHGPIAGVRLGPKTGTCPARYFPGFALRVKKQLLWSLGSVSQL